MDSVEETIKHIIVDIVEVELDQVHNDTDFVRDLGVDSLDIVEIAISIEKTYHIAISDEDYLDFRCVQDLIDYVNTKTQA